LFNGVIRRKRLQDVASDNSARTIKGSVTIFGADISDQSLSSKLEEYNIAPHDRNVIVLLDVLNLSPVTILNDIPAEGKLIWLQGQLVVRDFKRISDFVPAVAQNHKIFGIEKSEVNTIKRMFDAVAKIIPLNIEIECVMNDGETVRGTLKEDYLTTAYQDILAIYGTRLPGKWNVVGILDKVKTSTPQFAGHSFRGSVDSLSMVADALYKEGNPRYSLMPLLIFRELDK